MRKGKQVVEDICEDYCFSCKDGGEIRGCDFKNCLKAYHPNCIGKDESFLDSNEKWECPWHTCFICKNSALYQCCCCHNRSVCGTCIEQVEFEPLKRHNTNKGFCNNCLRLVNLIEGNTDQDSEGGRVDFNDTETYEYLFKGYWEIVKANEGISLLDLTERDETADYLVSEDEYEKALEKENKPDSSDSFVPASSSRKRKPGSAKSPKSPKPLFLSSKKWGAKKKRNFIGWGSAELIGFLNSVGEDTTEPITQVDASNIVERYVEQNNMYHPEKKRKVVICDPLLKALFGKGKVKTNQIYRMLESHFPGNESSEDEFLFSEDELDDEEGNNKKRRKTREAEPSSAVSQVRQIREMSEEKRKCKASLIKENIMVLFLRKSVVLELLKDPDTFEEKVKGCFVRMKFEPKDFYMKPRNLYQVGQVTGVSKIREEYKFGDISTNFILDIPNSPTEVKLTSLVDEEFDGMDLDDLKEWARRGLFKMPTIGEIEEKLKLVHEIIMHDWIEREMRRLDKWILLSNSKGWWQETSEYKERKKLMQKPEEKERLIRELPIIVVDPEDEKKLEEKENEEKEKQKGKAVILPDSQEKEKQNEKKRKFVFLPEESDTNLQKAVSEGLAKGENENLGTGSSDAETNGPTKDQNLGETANSESNGNGLKSSEEINVVSIAEATFFADTQNSNLNPSSSAQTLTFEDPKPNNPAPVFIDLSDSDDEQNDQKTLNKQQPETKNKEATNSLQNDQKALLWYYLDPRGLNQGPFSIEMLRFWKDKGYFKDDFKVWCTGQSVRDSVSLVHVIRTSQ